MSFLNETTDPVSESYLFVKCFNEDACLRGNEDNLNQNCAEGYTGVMCSACSDLHWKNQGNFECYPCNSADTNMVYFCKIVAFYLFCYTLGRIFLRGFSAPNSETLGAIKILLTFFQTMSIVSKMEGTRNKFGTEAEMQSTMDAILYYANPGEWLFDFDCLLISPEDLDADVIENFESIAAQKYIRRLLPTIFMPLVLLIANILSIWMITFCVKLCQFRKKEDMRPLNCSRLFDRVAIAFGI